MKYLLSVLLIVSFHSCSYKHIGEFGPNTTIIKFNDLPKNVKKAYQNEFHALRTRKVIYPVSIINLDSMSVRFTFLKSTSIEIIKPGKKIYKIGSKRFFLQWNSNREMPPRVLFEKNLYMIYATTSKELANYEFNNNFKHMKYLKVDLSKHLKY